MNENAGPSPVVAEGWGQDPDTLTPEQAFNAICQPDLVDRYTLGDCHLLAHRVATRLGWGITVVGEVEFESDFCEDACPADCVDREHGSWAVKNLIHAYATRPDGALVDIRGVHTANAAEDLAEQWGMRAHTYPSAAAADEQWDHAQWAESDEDIEDADYVAAYVARFGPTLKPVDPRDL